MSEKNTDKVREWFRTDLPASICDDGWLSCPRCKEEQAYLHQGDVEIFNRAEDAAIGRRVLVPFGTDKHDPVSADDAADMAGCPSLRRQGIRICFECEQCGHGLRLTIVQHKGATFLRWEQLG